MGKEEGIINVGVLGMKESGKIDNWSKEKRV